MVESSQMNGKNINQFDGSFPGIDPLPVPEILLVRGDTTRCPAP
jgi:hypothetical protein